MPPDSLISLGDLCFFVKETCDCSFANSDTYVSTESMLPNMAGITASESIPSTGLVNKYRPKDILVSNIRPYFKKIWQSDRCGTCSNDVLVIRAKDECVSDYLFALLSDNRFFDYIMLGSKGTKMPRGDKSQILTYPIKKQTFSEMLVIGNFISQIKKIITCIQAINDNLQAIAYSKYNHLKRSCVDYVSLSEIAEVCYGKDHKSLSDGNIPVYGSGGIMRYVERPLYDGKESVLIPRKGTLNNVMFVSTPFWSVDTMFYTKMKCQTAGKYLYFYLHDLDLASMNSGSAVPSMTTEILNDIQIPFPEKDALDHFDEELQPLFDLINRNVNQIYYLSLIRDVLLPKLMSGEIDVSTLRIPTKYSFGRLLGYVLLVCILHIFLINHSVMESCINPHMA